MVEEALRARRPHIVHAHDVNTLFAGWLYSRLHGAVLVYDAHELELHRNTTWTPLRRALTWVVELLGARAAAGVITVSDGIAHELRRLHRIPLPTVVLNSPDLGDVARARGDVPPGIRALAGLDDRDRIVVYVGKVARGRGVESLVSVLTLLDDDIHVVVLGPRDERSDALLVALAEELGVTRRLHLVPPIAARDVPSALRDADVFVNPAHNVCRSYDLALPNKLFDAVFAGLPVVVGRLREMERFVTANEIGLVYDEEDVASLAAAIRALLARPPAGVVDEDRLTRLQDAVSWQRQVEALAALYARVTARRGLEAAT
jgi:glycosyltransferase involved in cell wall biosynthesis